MVSVTPFRLPGLVSNDDPGDAELSLDALNDAGVLAACPAVTFGAENEDGTPVDPTASGVVNDAGTSATAICDIKPTGSLGCPPFDPRCSSTPGPSDPPSIASGASTSDGGLTLVAT